MRFMNLKILCSSFNQNWDKRIKHVAKTQCIYAGQLPSCIEIRRYVTVKEKMRITDDGFSSIIKATWYCFAIRRTTLIDRYLGSVTAFSAFLRLRLAFTFLNSNIINRRRISECTCDHYQHFHLVWNIPSSAMVISRIEIFEFLIAQSFITRSHWRKIFESMEVWSSFWFVECIVSLFLQSPYFCKIYLSMEQAHLLVNLLTVNYWHVNRIL